MTKRYSLLLVVILCASLLLTGCESLFQSITGSDSAGDYYEARMGEVLEAYFISYTVQDAWLASEFEGQSAPDGKLYLVAEIMMKNTSGDRLSMFAEEFIVEWPDESAEYGHDYGVPIAQFHDSQMGEEVELKKAETLTTLCVYEVPVVEEETDYCIFYQEYYEDDEDAFDDYSIYFELEP